MIVRCIANSLSSLGNPNLIAKLKGRMNCQIEQEFSELTVSQVYMVQAIELWEDGGIRVYLHVLTGCCFPSPFPVEWFDFVDASVPQGWSVVFRESDDGLVFKRCTFSSWAHDDHFYERLVDDDVEAIAAYHIFRR